MYGCIYTIDFDGIEVPLKRLDDGSLRVYDQDNLCTGDETRFKQVDGKWVWLGRDLVSPDCLATLNDGRLMVDAIKEYLNTHPFPGTKSAADIVREEREAFWRDVKKCQMERLHRWRQLVASISKRMNS